MKAHIDHDAGQMLASLHHLFLHHLIHSIWCRGRDRGRKPVARQQRPSAAGNVRCKARYFFLVMDGDSQVGGGERAKGVRFPRRRWLILDCHLISRCEVRGGGVCD